MREEYFPDAPGFCPIHAQLFSARDLSARGPSCYDEADGEQRKAQCQHVCADTRDDRGQGQRRERETDRKRMTARPASGGVQCSPVCR